MHEAYKLITLKLILSCEFENHIKYNFIGSLFVDIKKQHLKLVRFYILKYIFCHLWTYAIKVLFTYIKVIFFKYVVKRNFSFHFFIYKSRLNFYGQWLWALFEKKPIKIRFNFTKYSFRDYLTFSPATNNETEVSFVPNEKAISSRHGTGIKKINEKYYKSRSITYILV